MASTFCLQKMGPLRVKMKTMRHMKSVYNSEPDISKKSGRIQRVKVKYLKRIISTYLKINSFHKKIRAKELV